MPKFSEEARHNVAYFSFMILGLISLWTAYLVHSEITAASGGTSGVDGVLGFLVYIPLGIPLLLALVLGPGLSMLLWNDRRLVTLATMTLGLLVALVTLGYAAWPFLLLPYSALCLAISLLWILRYRRHFKAGSDSPKPNGLP
jgi:cytochrome bd-type quinol oxidase subunit 2